MILAKFLASSMPWHLLALVTIALIVGAVTLSFIPRKPSAHKAMMAAHREVVARHFAEVDARLDAQRAALDPATIQAAQEMFIFDLEHAETPDGLLINFNKAGIWLCTGDAENLQSRKDIWQVILVCDHKTGWDEPALVIQATNLHAMKGE